MATILTSEIMKNIIGNNNANGYINYLNEYMEKYEINTIPRIQFFIACACGETGGFYDINENLKYTNIERIQTVFKNRNFDKNENMDFYVDNPGALANRVYGGKCGNIQVVPFDSNEKNYLESDGFIFRGGGIFQLTYKSNYKAFAEILGGVTIDDLTKGENKSKFYVREKEGAVASACFYFQKRRMYEEADKNTNESFVAACKKVGKIGIDKKREYWEKCKMYIGDGDNTSTTENSHLKFLTNYSLNVFLDAKQKMESAK